MQSSHMRIVSLTILACSLIAGCCRSSVISGFGDLGPVGRRREIPHTGIDVKVCRGDWIIASASGVVTAVLNHGDLGYTLVITSAQAPPESETRDVVPPEVHPKYVVAYSHLVRMTARVGQTVKRGDVIATKVKLLEGLTPHVHVDLCIGNCYSTTLIDPEAYLSVNNDKHSAHAFELGWPVRCH